MNTLKVQELISAGNVRSDVDNGLAQSVADNGVLEPLLVYRLGADWVVQDGHRRLAAAVSVGLEEVPYNEIPAPTDEGERIAAQYIINQHRKPLSHLDQARVYQELVERGWTQKELAHRFNVSEATISLALSALRAHPIIRDALLEGKISPSAAELVTSLPQDEQEQIAHAVIQAKTVRKVTDVVRTHKKRNELVVASEKASDVDPFELIAVDSLYEALKNLQVAQTSEITDPELRTKSVMLLNKIIDEASKIQTALYFEEHDEAIYEYETM